MAAAAVQVRGYRDGRFSVPAPNVVRASAAGAAARAKSLKLERRNGSQSLSSSSSELQDSSPSPSSASPSSSSTLSLASSTLATVHNSSGGRTKPPNCNHDSSHKNYRQFTGDAAAVAATAAAAAAAATAVVDHRSQQIKATPQSRKQPAVSSGARKLAAPLVTTATRQLQTRRATSAASKSTTAAAVDRPTQDTRRLLQRYASLSSIDSSSKPGALHQRRQYSRLVQSRRPIEGHDSPLKRSGGGGPAPQYHHSLRPAESSSLLERTNFSRSDVRGRQYLHGRQSAAAQPSRQQPQVKPPARSRSVQQLNRISDASSLLLASSVCLISSGKPQVAVATASPAATNSRLRQAALYARRHSHITPTPPSTSAPAATTIKSNRRTIACHLIVNNPTTSLSSRLNSIPSASARRTNHASSPSLVAESRLRRISIGANSTSSKPTTTDRRSLHSRFDRPNCIQHPASSLSSSSSSGKRAKVDTASDSSAARDRHLLESRRRTPLSTVATAASRLPINTKSGWRSNLHQISYRHKMTTALVVVSSSIGCGRYGDSQQPAAILVAKKSGERSDGRSSSSSGSASDSCSDCSSSSSGSRRNDENVQPPLSVTRNPLPARANGSSGSTIATVGSNENNNKNRKDVDNGQVAFIESANIAKLVERDNENRQEDTTTISVVGHDRQNHQQLRGMVAATATTGTMPTLAVEVATDLVECPINSSPLDNVDSSRQQLKTPTSETSGGILAPRDLSLNIIQNNNNNISINDNQMQLLQSHTEENSLVKRPLVGSDIETACNHDEDDVQNQLENRGQKQPQTDAIDMTNMKIKIQRKLSVAPDVSIKTEPICLFYDLEARPFARGKFAQVKRCISKTTKQCFAAKCIKKRRRLVDIRHEIMLEIEALKLSHFTDHIVKLYEVFETPSEMILILEMANGGELQRVIDDEEAIEEKLVRRMIRQILEGLVQLHDNDIAHLDIKPQNLLLTEPFPGGDVKLCDFGISRRISKDCEIREICGTPDYVAPEILRYDPISLATDMWSLGVLTYVLLTGYSPFGSENRQQTFCNITQATLDFPSEIFYKISEDAVDFMQKLIVREPLERMTSQQARNHPWLCQ